MKLKKKKKPKNLCLFPQSLDPDIWAWGQHDHCDFKGVVRRVPDGGTRTGTEGWGGFCQCYSPRLPRMHLISWKLSSTVIKYAALATAVCCWDLMPNRSPLGVINYSRAVESSGPRVELPGLSWALCLRLLKNLLSPTEHVCHGVCVPQKKKKKKS